MFFDRKHGDIDPMIDQLPSVVVVMGLPGSGKTYLASRLARVLSAAHISSDQVRTEHRWRGKYAPEDKLRVYQWMMEQADGVLREGQSVILDATFHRRAYRTLAEELATEGSYPLHYIEVVADDAITRARTNRHRPDSEANYAVYRKLRREAEPLEQPHLRLDSSQQSEGILLQTTLDYLTDDFPPVSATAH